MPCHVCAVAGKAYAGWRGHDSDALSAYDALIASAPQDFRGYLAKGVFLKERGRRGDAERMFLQAKFYAPDSMQVSDALCGAALGTLRLACRPQRHDAEQFSLQMSCCGGAAHCSCQEGVLAFAA
jgi:Flp pilus assembly protein TadD